MSVSNPSASSASPRRPPGIPRHHHRLPPPPRPDFWLDHSFDRTSVVTHEIFELICRPRGTTDKPSSENSRLLREPWPPRSPQLKRPAKVIRRADYRWDRTVYAHDVPAGILRKYEPDVLYSRFGKLDRLSNTGFGGTNSGCRAINEYSKPRRINEGTAGETKRFRTTALKAQKLTTSARTDAKS